MAEEGPQALGALGPHSRLLQPVLTVARQQRGPVIVLAELQTRGCSECLQPLLQRPLLGLGKGLLQLCSAPWPDTRQLLQMLTVELQPIEQAVQLLAGQQRVPDAGSDTGKVQALLAGEPVQACKELLPTVCTGAPAAQGVVLLGVGACTAARSGLRQIT